MLRIVIFLWVFGALIPSKACSCVDVGLASQFAQAEYVFEGVSTGSHKILWDNADGSQMREITLIVGHVYKGAIGTSKVKVRTRVSGISCGTLLPWGGRYLVFGNLDGGCPVGENPATYLRSSLCMGNRFYPFWRFALRKNVRRLSRGEAIPHDSKWAVVPSW
jgi:hypothetical protein